MALERLSRFFLSGGRDGAGGAKPLIVVHVQAGDVTANVAGMVELNVRGALPTVTLKALEALSVDADMRAVLFDGARPLAVSKKLSMANPSADTRVGVRARDLGCRWPGSSDPVGWTDVDHLQARVDKGTHDPANLASFSRRFHVQKHQHGWKVALDGDSGELTISRRGKSFRSLPPGTPLSRPPDRTGRSGPPGSTPGSRPPTRRHNRPASQDPASDADPQVDDGLPF